MVKAIYPIMIDAEERRWEQKIGLDTQISLTVNDEWWIISFLKISTDVNAITIPPWEYGRKAETKKISRSRSKRSEACYLIRDYA